MGCYFDAKAISRVHLEEKKAEEQITFGIKIVLLQSLVRKRLALQIFKRKLSNRDLCLDILSECIESAVPEDDDDQANAGNGFQLSLPGQFSIPRQEAIVLLAQTT